MVNFILIAVCIVAGMLFRNYGALPADTHRGINAWIIYIALPAVSLKYLPHIHWDIGLLAPVIAPVLVWLGGWCMVKLYKKVNNINETTTGGLRLTAGLGNTSFIGFPLITAYFGEKYISTAIICDQVTFFLLATAGIIVSINASKKQKISARMLLKRVFTFPPFLGCISALVIPHFINISFLAPLFDKLAGTVAPLALFSIGLQLKFNGWQQELKPIVVTVFYKLILAPALVLGVFFILSFKGIIPKVSIFEAAMPPLLTSGVIADEYGLNPKLANLIIGIGIILSLFTTLIWYGLLKQTL